MDEKKQIITVVMVVSGILVLYLMWFGATYLSNQNKAIEYGRVIAYQENQRLIAEGRGNYELQKKDLEQERLKNILNWR